MLKIYHERLLFVGLTPLVQCQEISVEVDLVVFSNDFGRNVMHL